MPKKFVDTSPRRWGTRFDSLVPASPSIPPQTELSSPSAATPQSLRPILSGHRDLQKLPHDASVFVGSLPSAVDHRELIRALYDHLSPYAEIHNIKVVRDPRHGGVCAFVQCESADSAAQLIATLHAKPPPPFFGRTLRYERARSLRALFISYRAPTVFTPPDPSLGDSSGAGSLKPIDPATAMRLYKTQGSRFFSIKYNEAAREHTPGNSTEEDGLLLSPLAYDAEAVHQIASFFGPVDEIKTCTLDATVHPLHTAPRLPGMDASVWEANFNHRDDALNALMTLRTVPHLTVTWAHQSNHQEQGRSGQHTPTTPSVEEENEDPPGTTLPRAQSDAALSRHSMKCERGDKGTDSTIVNSDVPTRRASLSEDGFPPLVGKPVSWADDETLPPSDSSRTLKTTSEYGSVPPTPGFTSGSISPTTPLTFSSTPTTPHNAQFAGGFAGGSESLQYDYTSLFVGGLPPSWEEENVRNIFGRFPGLEEVQLIRPTMKKGSSFAFVKFDNTESPRKAIEAENDRVHDGRRIRVQIRDLNPPGRFAWKRGIQRHLGGGDNHDSFATSDLGYALHGDHGGGSINPPHPYPTVHQDKTGPLEAPSSVTTTPQPSTPGQQTSFVPYPYHPYYPATPWSYPHYPYHMHYYGYPAYGHVQPYPPPTSVYNPYAVVQPPTPTDPSATSSQPPGPPTPIKPVYNAIEHSGYFSDFQGDGPEARNVTTPPPGHLPTMAQATPPPPTSHPHPPVTGHPYPAYNPMQWAPTGPTTPHIPAPGVYMHFPAQAQMTPGRQPPTFPMVAPAPHNYQQRDSHRGRRNQRHQQRNTNGIDANIFASPNGHRQGLSHGFDHRNGVQPMPQWVNGGR